MGTLPFVPSNGRKTLLHFSNNLNASTALFRDSIMMAALLHKWSITLAAVCLSMATINIAPAWAAPLDPVYACAEIEGASERLACYDAAVGRLQEAEASGELTTVLRSEVEAVERVAFGFNLPALPRLKDLFGGGDKSSKSVQPPKRDALTAPVIKRGSAAISTREAEMSQSLSKAVLRPSKEIKEVRELVLGLRSTKEFGGSKKTRFYLDNGQVWDQQGSRRVRIPKEKNSRKNTVEIRKAALGSYLLRVNGEGAAIRVRRVR